MRASTIRLAPLGSSSVDVPRLELSVEAEAGAPADRRIVVDGDLARIGSNPANDLVLADPMVSRFHCRLTWSNGLWSIIDDASMNGTKVAGVRVRDVDLPLPECRMELGTSVVRVRDLGERTQHDVPDWTNFGALYGNTPVMRQLFALLDKVAKSESNVLIHGESGTGKEVVANEIVQRGPRADRPFVIVDCGAVSPTLIESELFGHVRGAFTGAERDRVGAFEAADGGTVFLDEVGELPLDMQPKLLRALETREVRRIGENHARKIDVRVIAATNRKLEREINQGRFREDLFFRLSVVSLRVPPLRDRREDIPILVDVFLSALRAADKMHLFTPEVLSEMKRYDWPGNVRELRNYVERSVVLDDVTLAGSRGSSIPPAGDQLQYGPNLEVPFSTAKEQLIHDFEHIYLTALLSWANGNVSKAARRAGMDRMYLHKLMARHELAGASFKAPPSSRNPHR